MWRFKCQQLTNKGLQLELHTGKRTATTCRLNQNLMNSCTVPLQWDNMRFAEKNCLIFTLCLSFFLWRDYVFGKPVGLHCFMLFNWRGRWSDQGEPVFYSLIRLCSVSCFANVATAVNTLQQLTIIFVVDLSIDFPISQLIMIIFFFFKFSPPIFYSVQILIWTEQTCWWSLVRCRSKEMQLRRQNAQCRELTEQIEVKQGWNVWRWTSHFVIFFFFIVLLAFQRVKKTDDNLIKLLVSWTCSMWTRSQTTASDTVALTTCYDAHARTHTSKIERNF